MRSPLGHLIVLALAVLAAAASTQDSRAAGFAFDGAPSDKRILSSVCLGLPPDCDGPCVWDFDDVAVPFFIEANGGSRLVCASLEILLDGQSVYFEYADLDEDFIFGVASVITPDELLATPCGTVTTIQYIFAVTEVPDDSDCDCYTDFCPGRRTSFRDYLVTLKCVPWDDQRKLKLNTGEVYRFPWRWLPEFLELPWTLSNTGETDEVVEVVAQSSVPWLEPALPPKVYTIGPGETLNLSLPVVRHPFAEPGAVGALAVVAKSLTSEGVVARATMRVGVVEPLPYGCATEDGTSCVVECDPLSGPCFEPRTTPACGDPTCCGPVCEVDPFCCAVAWDAGCVEGASILCASK